MNRTVLTLISLAMLSCAHRDESLSSVASSGTVVGNSGIALYSAFANAGALISLDPAENSSPDVHAVVMVAEAVACTEDRTNGAPIYSCTFTSFSQGEHASTKGSGGNHQVSGETAGAIYAALEGGGDPTHPEGAQIRTIRQVEVSCMGSEGPAGVGITNCGFE